jgi:hypothetical protein
LFNHCTAECSTYFTLGPVPPSYLALSWIIILLNVGMMVTFLYQLLRAVRTTVLLKVGMRILENLCGKVYGYDQTHVKDLTYPAYKHCRCCALRPYSFSAGA